MRKADGGIPNASVRYTRGFAALGRSSKNRSRAVKVNDIIPCIRMCKMKIYTEQFRVKCVDKSAGSSDRPIGMFVGKCVDKSAGSSGRPVGMFVGKCVNSS
jgi:hypothetical protein